MPGSGPNGEMTAADYVELCRDIEVAEGKPMSDVPPSVIHRHEQFFVSYRDRAAAQMKMVEIAAEQAVLETMMPILKGLRDMFAAGAGALKSERSVTR